MGKEKKVDSSIRVMMGDTRDVTIYIMKYKYPDLTMMMLNFLLELARAVEMNNKLAVSLNGLNIPGEHNISITFSKDTKIKLIDSSHDDQCSICNRPFSSDKGVFIKFVAEDEIYKIGLTKLAHMVYAHNAILPASLMQTMMYYFTIDVPAVRPISDWSKEELIAEINKLRSTTNLHSNVENTARINPLAETTTALPAATIPAAIEEVIETDDDSDDEEIDEEAEIVETNEEDDEDEDEDDDGKDNK